MPSSPVDDAPGIGPNILGPLCYAGGWLTGLTFFVAVRQMPATDPRQRFLRFHAAQSLVVFGAISIAWIVLGWVPLMPLMLTGLGFVLWLLLMFKAYEGGYYKLPIAGDFAQQL